MRLVSRPGYVNCDVCGKTVGPRSARRWDPGIGDRCMTCVEAKRITPAPVNPPKP
jgi:hypothetical protein